MATLSVQEAKTQRMCRILRESEERYRNELLEDEERQLLLDRIRRIRRTLEA
jgi:hemerythrin superfamily protein